MIIEVNRIPKIVGVDRLPKYFKKAAETYGLCPICMNLGIKRDRCSNRNDIATFRCHNRNDIARDRCPNRNDICENGHSYPSSTAIYKIPVTFVQVWSDPEITIQVPATLNIINGEIDTDLPDIEGLKTIATEYIEFEDNEDTEDSEDTEDNEVNLLSVNIYRDNERTPST